MSDWNDILKVVAGSLSSRIPYIGGVVSGLLTELWPVSKPDIWTLIRDQTSHLVDQKILDKEIEERQGELNGLKSNMRRYDAAKTHEKGAIMAEMLGLAEVIYGKLSSSSNASSLIPFAAAAAQIHLALLRERLSHGLALYEEDNTPVWKKELGDQYLDYCAWFNLNIPKWKDWRGSQIEARWFTTREGMFAPPFVRYVAHGDVNDRVTGMYYAYEDNLNSNSDYFKGVMLAIRQRLLNEAVAQMASNLTSTFLLHVYLPGQESDKSKVFEELRTLWLGPYSQATLGNSQIGAYSTNIEDAPPGAVTKILVRAGNSIDALQFFYTNREGHFVGNPKGGQTHEVVLGGNDVFTGLKLLSAREIMYKVEICISSGRVESFGNRENLTGSSALAVMQSPYSLHGVKYRLYHQANGIGISVIELRFDPT